MKLLSGWGGRALIAAAFVLTLAGGFVLGRRTSSPPVERHGAAMNIEDAKPLPRINASPARDGREVDPLRLRSEIAQGVGNALDEREQAAQLKKEQEKQPAAATPENIAAFGEAQAIIARASEARRWTQQEEGELRRAIRGTTRAQHIEIRQQLAARINSGELQVEPKSAD